MMMMMMMMMMIVHDYHKSSVSSCMTSVHGDKHNLVSTVRDDDGMIWHDDRGMHDD